MPALESSAKSQFERMAVRRAVLKALYVGLPIPLALIHIANLPAVPWRLYLTTTRGGTALALYHAMAVVWPYGVSALFTLPRMTGRSREFWTTAVALVLTTGGMLAVLLIPSVLTSDIPGELPLPLFFYAFWQAFILIVLRPQHSGKSSNYRIERTGEK